MPKLLFTLPLITALAIGTASLAQEEEEPAQDEPATETLDPGSTATEGLDMGREQEDPTYIKEEYEDWQLKCFRSEAEEDPCQMYQLLEEEEEGNPVAEFSIFRLPEGSQAAAGATIVVPLGTLLTEELKLSIDDGRAKSYEFSFCNMVGCVARIGLTSEDLAALKQGITANIQIVPAQAPDQTVDIAASLSGFTAAFDNTSVLRN